MLQDAKADQLQHSVRAPMLSIFLPSSFRTTAAATTCNERRALVAA